MKLCVATRTGPYKKQGNNLPSVPFEVTSQDGGQYLYCASFQIWRMLNPFLLAARLSGTIHLLFN